METEPLITPEIEETTADSNSSPTSSTSVKPKVPEAEIHVYKQGKGPIQVFKTSLGGWEQDQLEVRDILDKFGFKSIFAFSPASGRGAPILFHRVNGRSINVYRDGSVICIDGEPKDSLIKPVTKIIVGVAAITILIAVVLKEPPQWINKLNIFPAKYPPWILACVFIVFTRMRKRTRNYLLKKGW